MNPIRIVIGTEPRTEIARKVLEFSILESCKEEIVFYSIMGDDQKDRGTLGQGTGFSFLRFSIPEMFNYQGRAIYLDADMLVLSDISKLWNVKSENEDNIVWCKYGNEKKEEAETSMMVIDCEKAKDKLKGISEIQEYIKDDVDRKKYRNIMKLRYLEPRPTELSRWWNTMDKGCIYSKPEDFRNKKAKLLHYTNVRMQPWYIPEHPCSDIWGEWLKKAVSNQYVSMKEIKELCKKYDVSNPRRPNGMHKYWYNYLKENKC